MFCINVRKLPMIVEEIHYKILDLWQSKLGLFLKLLKYIMGGGGGG